MVPKKVRIISKEDFTKGYEDKAKLAQMIDKEVGPEPVKHVIIIDGMYLKELDEFLNSNGYTRWFPRHYRGEDLSRAKHYPMDKGSNDQRHGKAWYVPLTDDDSGIYTTWHNEPYWLRAVWELAGGRREAASKHTCNARAGNYLSGTKDFLIELGYFDQVESGTWIRSEGGSVDP